MINITFCWSKYLFLSSGQWHFGIVFNLLFPRHESIMESMKYISSVLLLCLSFICVVNVNVCLLHTFLSTRFISVFRYFANYAELFQRIRMSRNPFLIWLRRDLQWKFFIFWKHVILILLFFSFFYETISMCYTMIKYDNIVDPNIWLFLLQWYSGVIFHLLFPDTKYIKFFICGLLL